MGQYYLPVNLDKKEYLHNHNFGGGIKLCEHGGMILDCLVALLAESNGRGGGDRRSQNPIIGSWAGDRVMFAGDYADPSPEFYKPSPVWNEEKHTWENGPLSEEQTIYRLARKEWKDISLDIFLAMLEDPWFKDDFLCTYTLEETWYREWHIPDVLVTLAYALKHIELLPVLGNKASWAWRTLFGEGTQAYYRNMNGLIKHHPEEPRLYKKLRDLELALDNCPF